jgi:NitT/TauT family transport system ATP-binding protein
VTVAPADLLDPQTHLTSPLVRFEGVGKRFRNGTTALSGLDVGIGAGEFVSLLGPSGCGKSTALRLLAGLGRPSHGRIVWQEAPGPRDIGFVFQEPTLMPWATVARNVHLPLKLQGIGFAAARPRIGEALAMVGLQNFASSYPRELSGGMKMRVSIVRALVTRPRVLLMDEPFAALDEITRARLNDDLLRLWLERGFTTVFVTHSVYESVFLSSRILVMAARPGRIVADLVIDAPFPRDEAFRMSEGYNQRCREVSAALHRAMAE